jgi:pimeloyl-ACP methyl ester carboxylesterase
MAESTEPRLMPHDYRRDHMHTIPEMNDRCSRWLVSVALLTTLFASSPVWAANSRDFASTRHGALEATSVASGATQRVFELPLSPSETQRVLYLSPDSPRATIVMLPGGTGNIGLARDGDLRHGENFVVRTRGIWVANGYAVVIPDTIDHANLRGVRSSAEYASVVEALIRFAHTQASGPVILLGTSQGSIAAANGAAHARPGTLAGVVLTESVSRPGGSHETVFDAGLQNIRIPALVVANRNDRCDVAPPQDAPKIAAAMSHSPGVRLVQVSGGINASSNACASETPHGYYGMEPQVVETISDWIRNPLR